MELYFYQAERRPFQVFFLYIYIITVLYVNNNYQVVQCYNRGWDGLDVNWECKTDLDMDYRLGEWAFDISLITVINLLN